MVTYIMSAGVIVVTYYVFKVLFADMTHFDIGVQYRSPPRAHTSLCHTAYLCFIYYHEDMSGHRYILCLMHSRLSLYRVLDDRLLCHTMSARVCHCQTAKYRL